ncbi:hypothetical protein DFQ30_001166 [Apophysomyces sp. BC1015]|nr:hypothetical protein DFQ30_001166 [Apophysomyces sp. BC1015]
MLDSFDPISKQLRLMSSIIEYEDVQLTNYLESHDIEDFGKISRLFDLFVASSPLMPVYVASAITLLRRSEILRTDPDILHSLITHVPEDIDVELVIQTALKLEKRYPSLQLQKRSGIWLHDELG